MRWGNSLEDPSGPNPIIRILKSREPLMVTEKDMTIEERSGRGNVCRWRRDHKLRNAGSLQKLEGQETDSP